VEGFPPKKELIRRVNYLLRWKLSPQKRGNFFGGGENPLKKLKKRWKLFP